MFVSCTVKGKARQFENDGDYLDPRELSVRADMDGVEQRAARSLGPSQSFGEGRRDAVDPNFARLKQQKDALAQRERRFDFGNANSRARIGVSLGKGRHCHGKLGVVGVGMVAAKVAVETRSALHRAGRALVERHALRKRARGDEAVEVAFGGLEAIDVSHKLYPQSLERLSLPFAGGQITAQATRHENASKETASCQPCVHLLGPLFEQLALGLADLQRRSVAEMAEVMEVVVEAFEFCEQNAKRSSAKRRFTVGGALYRLTISERMCNASDPGDPLRHDNRLIGRTSLEARLHPAVLEEEPRW